MKTKSEFFDEVYAAKVRKPFMPFTLVLRDGKRYEIKDRFDMALSEQSRAVAVLVDEGRSATTFSWSDVVAVEHHTPAV